MTKANTNLPAKRLAEKAQPTIIIEGHETFEKLGMTATLIDGVEHFLDRSYAQKMGRTENTIQRTVEEYRLELKAYGTLRLVSKVFAVAGNGARLPIKAYWLNADQMMILAMQSRTLRGIAFRKTLDELVKAVRDGRLIQRQHAVLSDNHGGSPSTASVHNTNPALPFDMSKGLGPVPEVHEWALRFAVKNGSVVDNRDIPRSAKTDEGITLHVVGTKVHFRDADVAMLAGSTEAAVGDLITANIAKFETYGQIYKTAKAAVGRKKGASKDRLLNVMQTGMLLDLLEARGAPTSVRGRIGAIYKAYLDGTLADLCGDPVQRSNAIAIAQARLGYLADAVNAWRAPVLVIDCKLSDELAKPSYEHLGRAIKNALRCARCVPSSQPSANGDATTADQKRRARPKRSSRTV